MAQKILGVDRPAALLLGASSGIGEALATHLVRYGYSVALVARRAERLEALAEKLNEGHNKPVAFAFPHDVTQYDEIPLLFQRVCQSLYGLDLVVYMAGVMPLVTEDEYDFAKDQPTLEINLVGAVAWLNQAATRFFHTRSGMLVGVSSVAGERGRRGYPAYAASKAGLTTYLESLRNRLARRGVHVLTIKPGPVRTPMTQELGELPLMIDSEEAALAIMKAIRRKRWTTYIPGLWRPIMSVIRSIPSFFFRRLSL